MLKNECLVAKYCFDTAENEPSKVRGPCPRHRPSEQSEYVDGGRRVPPRTGGGVAAVGADFEGEVSYAGIDFIYRKLIKIADLMVISIRL